MFENSRKKKLNIIPVVLADYMQVFEKFPHQYILKKSKAKSYNIYIYANM